MSAFDKVVATAGAHTRLRFDKRGSGLRAWRVVLGEAGWPKPDRRPLVGQGPTLEAACEDLIARAGGVKPKEKP